MNPCVAGCDLLCILLCSLVLSLSIYSWVSAYHDSQKLVKMIRVKLPISRFWWFLALNDAEVGGHIFNLRTVNTTLPCRGQRDRSGQKQLLAHLQLRLESKMSIKGTRKAYTIK